MAVQQLFDAYSSTLSAPYTSGGSSLSVTAVTLPEGGNLPTSGNYTVTVSDPTTGAVKAIFTVTSRSGTTLTTSAQLDANCSSGDVITGFTLSKGSLTGLFTDYLGAGAYASAPSLASNQAGARYVATDSIQDEFRWNGTIWQPITAGIIATPPATADFPTFVHTNAAESVFSDAPGGGILTTVTGGAASDEFGLRVRAIPTAPYLRRMRWYGRQFNSGQANSALQQGMTLYDSGSGKLLFFGLLTLGDNGNRFPQLIVTWWNSITAFNASKRAYTCDLRWRNSLLDIGIEDDGAGNYNFWIYSEGQTRVKFYTESTTAFTTFDNIGYCWMAYTTVPTTLSIADWRTS